MSVLVGYGAVGPPVTSSAFARVRPQVLRVVMMTFQQAVSDTVARLGAGRVLEPRFTRQLFLDFQQARDRTPGSPRYDIAHQPEHVVPDAQGAIERLFRLDLRLVFNQQLGRTGDYLCMECKYLDTTDRATDLAYVNDGVQRFVSGDYGRGHHWAVMVGLERTGPLSQMVSRLDQRLKARYGSNAGFRPRPSVRLADVSESIHIQAGGPHAIVILHGLYRV